jgi:hypothetical protein
MYKAGFAGKAMFTYRYSYRPAVWERLLIRAGFATADAQVLDAPQPGHIGTLGPRGYPMTVYPRRELGQIPLSKDGCMCANGLNTLVA